MRKIMIPAIRLCLGAGLLGSQPAHAAPPPAPRKMPCDWRFKSVPHGMTLCRITRAAPGLGVQEVEVLLCQDGRLLSRGRAAPSSRSCPNGMES